MKKRALAFILALMMICGVLDCIAIPVSAADIPTAATSYSINKPARASAYLYFRNGYDPSEMFATPASAVDANDAYSYWMVSSFTDSVSFPQYLIVDLGEECAINDFDVFGLNPDPNIGWTCAIANFEIFGSNNAEVFSNITRDNPRLALSTEYEHASWDSIVHIGDNKVAEYSFTVPNITHYRYVMLKVNATDPFEGDAIRLRTFRVGYVPVVTATGITVDADCKPAAAVGIGDTGTFTATVTPDTATWEDVEWTSSDPAIVEVDSKTGKWEALTEGTATITAKTVDGTELTDTFDITSAPVMAESVAFDSDPGVLDYDVGQQLFASVSPINTTDKTLTWSSSNPENISVDLEGNILGLKPQSSSTITVTTSNGKTASMKLSVGGTLATGVDIQGAPATAAAGEKGMLEAIVFPDDVSVFKVTWTSSDEAVIKIDPESGLWEAVGAGTATITASTKDGSNQSDSVTITVNINVKEITVLNTPETANIGDTGTFAAVVTPENATNTKVTWQSSDPKILAVDADTGAWTAVGGGNVTVTAKANDGSSAEYSFDIAVIVDSAITLTLDESIDSAVSEGETVTVYLKASNETDKIGAFDITIKYDSDVLEVVPADGNNVGSISDKFNFGQYSMAYFDYGYVNGVIAPGVLRFFAAGDGSFTKTDDILASVTFRVKSNAPSGDTLIYFAEDSCDLFDIYANEFIGDYENSTLTVKTLASDIKIIDVPAESVEKGTTGTLTAIVTPDDATDKTVIWSSSDTSVVTVDPATGVWTAVGKGTATITATAAGGTNITDTVDVTVVVISTSVEIGGNTSIVANKDEVGTLSATVTPGDATDKTITWTSSNTTVINIDYVTGAWTAMGVGTATITATVDGTTITDTVTITVVQSGVEVLLGDINRDGKISITDALSVFKHIAGKVPLTGNDLTIADANGDKSVTILDALAMFQHISGKKPITNKVLVSAE